MPSDASSLTRIAQGDGLTKGDDWVTCDQVTEFEVQSLNCSCSVAVLPRHRLPPVTGLFGAWVERVNLMSGCGMLVVVGLEGHLAQKETPLAGWRAGFEKVG